MTKKLFFGIFCLIFLNGCVQNTAFLGPAYTFGSSGNVAQAGLSYGSEKIIIKMTGKSTGENIKEVLDTQKKNKEISYLVKKRIIEARKKLGNVKISQ